MTAAVLGEAAWTVLWSAGAALLVIGFAWLLMRREDRRDAALSWHDQQTAALFAAMNENVPWPGRAGLGKDPLAGPGRHARRDGMGAQGEPATGLPGVLPGANTIPPRIRRWQQRWRKKLLGVPYRPGVEAGQSIQVAGDRGPAGELGSLSGPYSAGPSSDGTLTTMLAVHARDRKAAMAEAVRRTDAVLARAAEVLAVSAS